MGKIIYIGTVFALLAGFPAQANVSNEVNVSASAGGNGKSEAHIFIETTVNGEVVEQIDKHVVSEEGEAAELYVETNYESEPIEEQNEEEAEPVESEAPSSQEDITITNTAEEGRSHFAVWFDLLRSTFIRYGNYFFGIFRV